MEIKNGFAPKIRHVNAEDRLATAPPTPAQVSAIVNFELGLHSAQIYDNSAGLLTARGAQGGPFALSQQNYYPGINDVVEFYNQRFQMNLSDAQKHELVAFLKSL